MVSTSWNPSGHCRSTFFAQGRSTRGEQDVKAGWFYRSDQIAFARIGVPAIWFKSGSDFTGRPAGWGDETYARWIDERYHRLMSLQQEIVFAGQDAMDRGTGVEYILRRDLRKRMALMENRG